METHAFLQPLVEERLHEECGVVGVYTPGEDAARLAFFSLFALQHRGQESAGIATSDGNGLHMHKAMGLATQVFHERHLDTLLGHMAIGHVRYSTTGSSSSFNAQPMRVEGIHGELAVGHNGNIVNSVELRNRLRDEWHCTFHGSSDTEVIAHLFANAPGRNWQERVATAAPQLHGAYSLVLLTKDALLAVRDPLGVRPLCLGKINGGWIVASESCALDHIGAELVREIEPGEVVTINSNGVKSFKWTGENGRRALCVFELIYFARPDSIIAGKRVYTVRMDMGAQLAREHPVEADVVVGVPDSATAAAAGYSRESGIPFAEGLVKNRYVGRTFIQPDQRLRDVGVRLKFNPLPEVLAGKRVVVVDDSIVRGTTTPHVLALFHRAGAKEVHMRVCAPPLVSPCHLGVDMATRRELLAANHSLEEIRRIIGADTLGYLSVNGLMKVVDGLTGGYCNACFTGEYPIPVQLEMDKLALEHT